MLEKLFNRPQQTATISGAASEMPTESPLTAEERRQVIDAIRGELAKKPPTIGVIGVSGVGKSSSINRLCNTNLPVSHTRACTKEFEATDVSVSLKNRVAGDMSVAMRVVDAPGLGEDMRLDPKYLRMYEQHLPDCDVILYVLSARNRAIALDQQYLEMLNLKKRKVVVGINQVDLVEPRNWNERINLPSDEQDAHIAEIVADRREKLAPLLAKGSAFVPYSAERGFGLSALFEALVRLADPKRDWLLAGLKGFTLEDEFSVEVLAQAKLD